MAEDPQFQKVLDAAARLQRIVPDAVLVVGSAARRSMRGIVSHSVTTTF